MERILCILSIGLIIVACKDKREPKLDIKDESLEFSIQSPDQTLVLANIGEGTLNWFIEDLPDWLEANKENGSLGPGFDEIKFSADLNYEPGVYSNTITLFSNGGKRDFTVHFDPSLGEFTIMPGIGITNIDLNDAYNNIIKAIGEPDTILHFLLDNPDPLYQHSAIYRDLDLELLFLNEYKSVINPNDPLLWIYCDSNFSGETNEGITFGSSLPEVEAAYGMDYEENYEEDGEHYYYLYQYYTQGIGFYFLNNQSDSVGTIEIFSEYTFSGNRGFQNKFMRP